MSPTSASVTAYLDVCCHVQDKIPEVEVNVHELHEPAVRTWTVDLDKANYGKLGLELVPQDNVLKVEAIEQEGTVSEYNNSNPKEAVRAGDFVTQVNGVKGAALKMLAEVRKEVRKGRLNMTLARTRTFRVVVTKKGPLGATFGVFSRVLVLQDISEGPLMDWNRGNPSFQVEVGDQIIEVNGAKDNPNDLLENLKPEGELALLVLSLGGAGAS